MILDGWEPWWKTRSSTERLLRAAQPRPPKGSNGGNNFPIVVGLEQNNVTVDNVEYALQPHHVQILNALVESRESGEWWVTGGTCKGSRPVKESTSPEK